MKLPATILPSKASKSFSSQLSSWSVGISDEIQFWDKWLLGEEWPEDHALLKRADTEWANGNDPVPAKEWKVLDVGAGPATTLSKMRNGVRIDITAVDPLAPSYRDCRERAGYRPPVETQQGFAEDLTAIFDENTYDLTNMSNALDHSMDPLRAIEEMLIVTKVGGYVTLLHMMNEGQHQNYNGFHKWNFCLRDGKFFIWNDGATLNVEDIFKDVATFRNEIIEDGSILRTVIRKSNEVKVDLNKRRMDRLQEVLCATLETVYCLNLDLDREKNKAEQLSQRAGGIRGMVRRLRVF